MFFYLLIQDKAFFVKNLRHDILHTEFEGGYFQVGMRNMKFFIQKLNYDVFSLRNKHFSVDF